MCAPAALGTSGRMDEIERLLELQDGVIARRQAVEAGLTEVGIARLLRRTRPGSR